SPNLTALANHFPYTKFSPTTRRPCLYATPWRNQLRKRHCHVPKCEENSYRKK
ncbi:hypothetical protein L9F63_023248, partial [Diploptera punctata]